MKRILLLSILFVSILGACMDSLGQQKKQVANDYVQSPSAYSKPGAVLTLVNSQVNLQVAGVDYAVNIDINSDYADGSMTLSVSASDGLSITDGELNPTISLKRGVIHLPYQLMAQQPGRYYLYINATVDSGGKKAARAMTFIVQVGEEREQSESPQQKNDEAAKTYGERVKSLPAQEKER